MVVPELIVSLIQQLKPTTMQTMTFNPALFNEITNKLVLIGYDEYLNTVEDGVTHIILTNTNPGSPYTGSVIDLYDNGRIELGSQFRGNASEQKQPIESLNTWITKTVFN